MSRESNKRVTIDSEAINALFELVDSNIASLKELFLAIDKRTEQLAPIPIPVRCTEAGDARTIQRRTGC